MSTKKEISNEGDDEERISTKKYRRKINRGKN
jgi:hypothetical protein